MWSTSRVKVFALETTTWRAWMSGIVMSNPIAPGKVEAWRRFCQELGGARRQTYEASRRRLGITRERLGLVETPFGSAAITAIDARDVGRAMGQIMTSDL